jgi:hypothetical protein
VGVSEKLPRENNLDHEFSNFLNRQLMTRPASNLQALSTRRENKSQPHRTHLELGATAEPNK